MRNIRALGIGLVITLFILGGTLNINCRGGLIFDSGHIPDGIPPDDNFWDFYWYSTYTEFDNDNYPSYEWEVGAVIRDIYYRDYRQAAGDEYNKYIDEICVPWLRLKYSGRSVDKYEFSSNTNCYSLRSLYNGVKQITEDGTGSGGMTHKTIVSFQYDLDIDDEENGEADFQFTVTYLFYQYFNDNKKGAIEVKITIDQWPAEGSIYSHTFPGEQQPRTCEFIEFVWRIDPCVYDNVNNKFKIYDPYQPGWKTKSTEDDDYDDDLYYYDGTSVKITNDQAERKLRINPSDDLHAHMWYFYLTRKEEYSLWPSWYDEDEDINNEDIVLWIIERYTGSQQSPFPRGIYEGPRFMICNFEE
ncbi:MAG: hypothetical protein QXD84_09570 [Thermoplasmata archaeon]